MSLGPPINITPLAAEKIKIIRKQKEIPEDHFLRVGRLGGMACGASTPEYVLGFDQSSEHDASFVMDEIRVIIDKQDMLLLAGVEIDYVETEEKKGFIFRKNEV